MPATGRARLRGRQNPNRRLTLLLSGGLIPPGWHDHRGKGPEECRRRLEEEAVNFDADGRADPRKRVSWDVLVERADEAGD